MALAEEGGKIRSGELVLRGLVWVGQWLTFLPVAQRTNSLTYGVVGRTDRYLDIRLHGRRPTPPPIQACAREEIALILSWLRVRLKGGHMFTSSVLRRMSYTFGPS